jgi:hypothetical protein
LYIEIAITSTGSPEETGELWISAFYGIAIYMYYRDHASPHFHAIYGEFEATVSIGTGEVLDGRLLRLARSLVAEWAATHQDELQISGNRRATASRFPPSLDWSE